MMQDPEDGLEKFSASNTPDMRSEANTLNLSTRHYSQSGGTFSAIKVGLYSN